jgi:DNA-binding transcriptional LysR family regulator
MRTRTLETLQRIARIGSFSQAAEEANMTLSSVSMQMKTLEEDLGAELFDRSCRPPRLTPLGRRVAEQAGNVLREDQLMRELCAADSGLVGSFRLGVISSFSTRLMPKFLQMAPMTAPEADFNLVTGLSADLCESVLSGKLDAAIVTRAGREDPLLRFDTLGRDPMVLAVPEGSQGRTLHQLADELRFLHFQPLSGIGRVIAETLAKQKVNVRRARIFDSIETTMECVNIGIGFTVLPAPDVKRYAAPGVSVMDFANGKVEREIALVCRDEPGSERWRVPLLDLLAAAKRLAEGVANSPSGEADAITSKRTGKPRTEKSASAGRKKLTGRRPKQRGNGVVGLAVGNAL